MLPNRFSCSLEIFHSKEYIKELRYARGGRGLSGSGLALTLLEQRKVPNTRVHLFQESVPLILS